ncbi:MAG: hypothetical protein KBD50_02600 [Candidatus Pacebacteria bacterium]|nr:hypothetical protein [Candidatus Paceibacterota bacterium]
MSLGVRHVSKRRKARLAGLPTRSSVLKNALDLLIYPVAIAAPLALFPQVLQVYQTKDASSLALPTWLILGILNVVWMFYGVVHKERPIVLTNVMLALLNFAVVVGIVLYT